MTSFPQRLPILACVLALALSAAVLAKQAPGATQFRGPSVEGPAAGGDLPGGAFGLRVAWKRELGSGYSNVWITDDKLVTMFTAGVVDVLAAFDLADGEELWR